MLKISDYNYDLPEEKIAKFPLAERQKSKLLIYDGKISESIFERVGDVIPSGSLVMFNNTKVIRARIIMHKSTGARIEVFCLEPHLPADYERAFAVTKECCWRCIIGNAKKWKEGELHIDFQYNGTPARVSAQRDGDNIVRFRWNIDATFGQVLETLGQIPIPPYLCRDSEEIDNVRYQTVYSKLEGSVAAPTAGLHFTTDLIDDLKGRGFSFAEVTLHVGAGTFLPVKSEDVTQHAMHTEHFEITLSSVEQMILSYGKIVAVGTTTVRTIESLASVAYRIAEGESIETPIGQWESYDIPEEFSGKEALEIVRDYMVERGLDRMKCSTQIMIRPGFKFRFVGGMITNFHQPKSTLLLLVSALVGDSWIDIYNYALANGFRFLSYGDSSYLKKQ